LLLFRAPNLAARVGDWLRDKTRRGTGVWTFLLSLLRVALPVAGLALVAQAGRLSGLLGPRGIELALMMPVFLFIVLFTRWLAAQRFTHDEDQQAVALAPERRTEARFYANTLGWLFALNFLVVNVSEFDSWSDVAVSVILLPIHIVTGLLLFRLGQILSKVGPLQPTEDDLVEGAEPSNFPARLARLAGKGAMIIGVVGPILSAIGYLNVAQAMIFPAVLSLGLFGIVLTLQGFVKDVYHLVTGRDLDKAESLVPVFTGIFLTIGSLPILALIWGARDTDLTELWARFQAGFSFGETRISPTDFLTFAVVFGIGYAATRLLQGGLRGSVLPKTGIDKGGQTAIVSGTGYVGIFLAAVIAITAAGIDLSALAIVAGALSGGIGFGLQNIVQNFVSGIILLVERPIAEGDWIEVGGHMGTVRDISVRSTRIETFDRTDVIIPNADFVSNSVTNYTRGNSIGRLIVDVGVAYGTDTRKVSDILYKIARDHEMVLMNPEPFVYFKGFGADSLDFDVRVILRDVTQMLVVRTELNHQINEAFAAEGIEIPFAQRDVWLRNPEALSAAAPSKNATAANQSDAAGSATATDDPDEAAS
ncbi:MAG TPA: mechanosensitive ion channel domain-containing protein, partial [Marivita sp.]|nr:mechanosensitive ion channel domain-containing protein [Marivita sp.]